VRALRAEDLPACAGLLAERHRRHRAARPLLSDRYAQEPAALAELENAFAQPEASGAIALRGNEMVGYLLGTPKPDAAWGPNIWVEGAGHAAVEAETIRDLYAFAAAAWRERERTAHYALVPAYDAEAVRAWFRLGFGLQHVHGIRESARLRTTDAVVRPATRADIEHLAALDLELPRHQQLAPTFSAGAIGSLEESLADWAEDIDSDEYATFVAERDGEVVGSAVGCAVEKSRAHIGLARPDGAAHLGFVAVFPSARGAGAGRALGEAVVSWAADAGYVSIVTDWRATNLLSSRTWPKLGFEESFVRLHRLIGY
jgi:GNAT superfamily N-acetyltransferase